MLQDALCCRLGLFQQVLTASAGSFMVPLYVLVVLWMEWMKAGKEIEFHRLGSLPHSVFVLSLSRDFAFLSLKTVQTHHRAHKVKLMLVLYDA